MESHSRLLHRVVCLRGKVRSGARRCADLGRTASSPTVLGFAAGLPGSESVFGPPNLSEEICGPDFLGPARSRRRGFDLTMREPSVPGRRLGLNSEDLAVQTGAGGQAGGSPAVPAGRGPAWRVAGPGPLTRSCASWKSSGYKHCSYHRPQTEPVPLMSSLVWWFASSIQRRFGQALGAPGRCGRDGSEPLRGNSSPTPAGDRSVARVPGRVRGSLRIGRSRKRGRADHVEAARCTTAAILASASSRLCVGNGIAPSGRRRKPRRRLIEVSRLFELLQVPSRQDRRYPARTTREQLCHRPSLQQDVVVGACSTARPKLAAAALQSRRAACGIRAAVDSRRTSGSSGRRRSACGVLDVRRGIPPHSGDPSRAQEVQPGRCPARRGLDQQLGLAIESWYSSQSHQAKANSPPPPGRPPSAFPRAARTSSAAHSSTASAATPTPAGPPRHHRDGGVPLPSRGS